MKKKIILGSAKFGLKYGLSGKKTKVTDEEIEKIFKYFLNKKIFSFDTSYDYGLSERNIFQKFKNKSKVYSKFTKKNFDQIFKHFKLYNIKPYCLTFHKFEDYLDKKFRTKVINKAKKNNIHKIGVSIYSSDQYSKIENDVKIIQLPISIIDQYFIDNNFIQKIKKRKIEIHARSVFFRGLLASDLKTIKKKYPYISSHINLLSEFARKSKLKMHELSLVWINSLKDIDKIILGVDSLAQLKRNLELLNTKKPKNLNILFKNLKKLKKVNFDLSKWK